MTEQEKKDVIQELTERLNEVVQLQIKMDVLWTDYQQRKQIEDDLK